MVQKNYSPGLFPTWWLCDPSSNKLRCEAAWPQKGTSQNLDSNPQQQQPTLSSTKNVFFPRNNLPPQKKKHLLGVPEPKGFKGANNFLAVRPSKPWVFPNRDRLSRGKNCQLSVGSVLNHWRQPRHLDEVSLGHGRADTSTFKSVQLVPAHVDNMFLDIKCFDHRNAVFKKKKCLQKESKVLVMRHSNQLELAPPGAEKRQLSSWPSQHGQHAAAPAAEALYWASQTIRKIRMIRSSWGGRLSKKQPWLSLTSLNEMLCCFFMICYIDQTYIKHWYNVYQWVYEKSH